MAATRRVLSLGLSPVAACGPIHEKFASAAPSGQVLAGKAPVLAASP